MFTVVSFSKPDELVVYLNDNSILQTAIVAIREKDGAWWLFYFA